MYKKSEQGWLLTAVFTILWLFFLVTAYFWAHKPFDFPLLAGVGRSLAAVVGWLGVMWLATAVGWRLGHSWLVEESPRLRLALATGLGLGFLSLLMLLLGLVGRLQPWVAWLLVGLLGLVMQPDLRLVWQIWQTIPWPQPVSRFERWLWLYLVVSLTLAFIHALTPETAWDALVYHLTGPRLFVQQGQIRHSLDLLYLGFPQLGEMQFTLGLLLVGDGVAPLLHFGYGVLAVAVAVGFAMQAFGRLAGWLTAVTLLSVPLILELMGDAYVDLALLYYATAAFYLFWRWQNGSRSMDKLVWLGLFCGLAAGVKYTAVGVLLAIGLCLLWASRREGLAVAGRRMGLLTAVTVLVASPWLLENWFTTGNPFYPFFIDKALYWDSWRTSWFDRAGTGLLATAPWRLLTAPLEATILGTTGSQAFDATIGPFVLGGVVLLTAVWPMLSAPEKKTIRYLGLFLAVNYALWLWGLARSGLLLQSRLLLPMFGVTAVVVGLTLAQLTTARHPQLDVGWLTQAVLSLALGLLLLNQFIETVAMNPLPVLVGLESQPQFLRRQLGSYQLAIDAINALPPTANVLFLWEPRSYDCRAPCQPDALLDRLLHHTQGQGHDAAAIAQAWQRAGVTHVLLYQTGLDFVVQEGFDPITPADLAVLEALQTTYLETVAHFDQTYMLYRLK